MMQHPYGSVLRVVAASAILARGLAAQGTPSQPTTTVGGVAYAQYLYQLADTANHLNNFELTRAYLNFLGRFTDGLATRVTADVYRNADGSLAYRIKYAYAAYTPARSALTFKLGVTQTALLDWEEALWDYRMQGTMPLERGGYVSSADLGFGVDGHWKGERVNAQVAVVNGEYYSRAPGDKRKDAMARVSVRLKDTDDASRVGGLRLTAYGQLGAPTTGGTRNRLLGMLSYRSSRFTLVGEAALTEDAVGSPAPPTTKGRVLSGYGVYRVPKSKFAFIGRVDVTDPNTSAAGVNDRTTRLILGASHQLTPNLRLLANWDWLSFEGGPTPAQQAIRSQGLVQMQFTF